MSRGVHPSAAMMYFPLFKITLFPKTIVSLRGKLLQFPVSPQNSRFSSSKISDDLLFVVIDSKFRISLCFPCFCTLPVFRENYHFPLLLQLSPDFVKFTCFYILFVFSFLLV